MGEEIEVKIDVGLDCHLHLDLGLIEVWRGTFNDKNAGLRMACNVAWDLQEHDPAGRAGSARVKSLEDGFAMVG